MYKCCDQDMEFFGVDGNGGWKYSCRSCYKIEIHRKFLKCKRKFEDWSECFIDVLDQEAICYGIIDRSL